MSDEEKKFGKGSEGSFDKGHQKSSEFGNNANDGFEKAEQSSKNFSDDAKKSAKDFGDRAQEEFKKTKESTKGFASESKKAANDFGEGAKKSANEFRENARETFSGVGVDNKKILAGILAIVLGGFGIHKFILGYTKEGIIMLVITIGLGAITCGMAASAMWIIGVIEGIIYLTKTDEEFYNIYQVGRKPWF